MSISPETTTLQRPGLIIGIGWLAALSRQLVIQPEANFTQLRTGFEKQTQHTTSGAHLQRTQKTSIDVTYLEIPVLLKWRFDTSPIDFYVLAGPSLAITLSGKRAYNEQLHENGQKVSEQTFQQLMTIDNRSKDTCSIRSCIVAAQIGLGMGIDIPLGQVLLDIRYHRSLHPIMNAPQYASIEQHGLSLSLCYMFDLEYASNRLFRNWQKQRYLP